MVTNAPKGQYCRHYARGQCTGCTLLHLPYEAQLKGKGDRVRATLAPALDGDPLKVVRDVVPSPRPMGYRTSVKWCLNEDREGRRAVGLYRQGSRQVVPVPDCPATEPKILELVDKLFHPKARLPARLYDHRGRVFQRRRLKFMIVRFGPPDGMGVILSHTGVPRTDLVEWIQKAALPKVSFYESLITPHDRDSLTGRDVRPLAGPELFAMQVAGRTFSLSPESFFQANYSLSGRLIQAATAFATDGDVLLDLYGGFGAYSFQLLERFREIHVVDGNAAAVRAAALAAKGGQGDRLSAHGMYCERFLAEADRAMLGGVTHAIVNPPRQGLSRDVSAALCERLPRLRELNYVSCNPETLARDLRVLKNAGWRVVDVTPFDMFPQTEHVENVVRLMRQTAAALSGDGLSR